MNENIKSILSEEERHKLTSSPLDGIGLKVLLEAGLTWLRTNQQHVNSLNVFPVPDGDTGTNMVLTMQAAYDEVNLNDYRNVGDMAHALAQGALMGARGNSGVILSNMEGVCKGIRPLRHNGCSTFYSCSTRKSFNCL
jgi:dihydroxyacetone kinase-like predicted kinase